MLPPRHLDDNRKLLQDLQVHEVLDIARILQSLYGSKVIENRAIEQTNKQKKSGDFARILQSLDCSNILENQANKQDWLYSSISLQCSIANRANISRNCLQCLIANQATEQT